MEKKTLHLNTHCKECDNILLAGTEAHAYYSDYLNQLVAFCDSCYQKKVEARINKVREDRYSHSVRTKRIEKLKSDKNYMRLDTWLV